MEVDGITVAKAQEIEDASIVSGYIAPGTGHLILVNGAAAEVDAGLVVPDDPISGTLAEYNTALSDGNFATLAGAETFTNKTLTSPVLDTPTINSPVITGLGELRQVTKAVQENIASSTALQNDDELTMALEANEFYRVEFFILYAGVDQLGSLGNPGGFDHDIAVPAGSLYSLGVGATAQHLTTGIANTLIDSFSVFLKTAGTAGNVTLRWAQVVSSATATRVFPESRLVVTKLS